MTYMTKQRNSGKEGGDRPALEIEVTPEMAALGAAILLEWESSDSYSRTSLAADVYRRMKSLDPELAKARAERR